MADQTPREVIAATLVACRSNGLCPLDGPCEACDCFDPQHRHDRDHADHVLAALRDAGKVIVDAEELRDLRDAKAKLGAITGVRTWRNEDGKSFIFTEDISAILFPRAALAATEETPETRTAKQRSARVPYGLHARIDYMTEHGMVTLPGPPPHAYQPGRDVCRRCHEPQNVPEHAPEE